MRNRIRQSGVVGILILLAAVCVTSCDSPEEYMKAPEPTPEPLEGTVKVTGTPEQMQLMQAMAIAMDGARARWVSGDFLAALGAVDSLVSITEGLLDTIPLDQSFSEFLTIYVADGYGTLQEWHTARADTAALRALTRRYQTLARDLQARRDSAQTAP